MLEGGSEVIERLQTLYGAVTATCTIVRGELVFMAERSQYPARNLRRVDTFLAEIEVHPITALTADLYGRLKVQLMDYFGPRERAKARRTTIHQIGFSDNDCWIAAVAQERKLIVATADRDFRRMAEVIPLTIEAWWNSNDAG